MGGKGLLLIGPTAPPTGAGLVDQVLRCCPQLDRSAIGRCAICQVLADPAILDRNRVIWMVLDRYPVDGLQELIGLLQDRHSVSMLSRPQETKRIGDPFVEGVVTAPPQASAATIAAVLRALASQGELVHALKTEFTLLRLQHGGVVDQFDKIDEELRLASQLQREFMSGQLPEISNVSFHVLFRPTGYVSGDIYDVAPLDEDHVGIFLADAVGHGVPAALMTVYIKSSLSTHQLQGADDGDTQVVSPNKVLAGLNRDLIHHQKEHVLTATAAYGVLNINTFELEISRAGHPYPLLYRTDAAVDQVCADGAMLGVFPEEEFELVRLQLDPGDRLIFFSDGFETAFPSRQALNLPAHVVPNDEYLKEFRKLAEGCAKSGLDRLSAKLDQQIGSLNQLDDLTVLMMSITGSRNDRAETKPTSCARVASVAR